MIPGSLPSVANSLRWRMRFSIPLRDAGLDAFLAWSRICKMGATLGSGMRASMATRRVYSPGRRSKASSRRTVRTLQCAGHFRNCGLRSAARLDRRSTDPRPPGTGAP